MLVQYLPVQTAPTFPFDMTSIQLPSMSHLLAAATHTTTTTTSTTSILETAYQQQQVAGIMRRPKLSLSREEFLAATSSQSNMNVDSPTQQRPKLTLSREGLPYDAQGGATMMLSMREALCQFSLALENATTRQEQADIYFKRANLYFKYGLHAEALRDCNNSYNCFPSPSSVQLRSIIAKKFQSAQYEFNETGINILKEKLQHAMQERSNSVLRQC